MISTAARYDALIGVYGEHNKTAAEKEQYNNYKADQFASQYDLSGRFNSEILSFPELKRQLSNNKFQDDMDG